LNFELGRKEIKELKTQRFDSYYKKEAFVSLIPLFPSFLIQIKSDIVATGSRIETGFSKTRTKI
jgi:hypothetical protein